MRLLFLLAIVVAVFCMSEARKKHGKEKLKMDALRGLKGPSSNPYHLGVKYHRRGKHFGGKLRGQHLMLDTHQDMHMKSLQDHKWTEMPIKSKECKTMKCAPKHFCITHPKTGAEKCISRRNFRQIRRMFKSFHKRKLHGGNRKVKDFERKKLKLQELMDNEDYKHLHEFNFLHKPSDRGLKHHGLKMHADLKQLDHKDLVDVKKGYKDRKHGGDALEVKSILDKQPEVKEAGSTGVEECRPLELYQLRKRLTGWFVLLHTESRQQHHIHAHHERKKHLVAEKANLKMQKDHHVDPTDKALETESHGHCKCSKSVMWEFRKQDGNDDGHLSHEELANMESNRREPCMKLLLKSCDHDDDGLLSRGEFCCCMADNVPPCAEKKRLSDPKDWVPRCDKEGYYQREQCHKSTGYCWCVDLNGNPIGSKTLGNPHCGRYDPNGHLIKQ